MYRCSQELKFSCSTFCTSAYLHIKPSSHNWSQLTIHNALWALANQLSSRQKFEIHVAVIGMSVPHLKPRFKLFNEEEIWWKTLYLMHFFNVYFWTLKRSNPVLWTSLRWIKSAIFQPIFFCKMLPLTKYLQWERIKVFKFLFCLSYLN